MKYIAINPMVVCPRDKRYVKTSKCAGCSDRITMTETQVLCRIGEEME